ncbi:hypothetical protein WA1_26415 [Scytonema hofmannii PCC 7110]|uniref:Tyrosine kinase G-rich domain-containing protein n=1 Tax=Scytonema hofmannii PCC 7110 TaxID=128403 RepID=A0A139X754_9CYAN|nr:hypothetical protein [Scytonema hofmannii]KYC40462.1 hypothetical protein WA1_26415 [Scytonema hofmannii PCC 7110]
MTKTVTIPNFHTPLISKKILSLISFWLLANVTIWGVALLYLKQKSPSYKSQWTISLPAAKSSTKVSVPGIGEASSSSDSPFASQSSDPRENYKFIAQTEEVLTAAARELKIPPKKFGKPKIKILDNTTLIQFEIEGDSPEEAQKKAIVLQKTLEDQLDELRKVEIAKQDQNLEVVLGTAEKKLQAAQQRLAEYQTRSRLSSNEQLQDLSQNIEALRRQRAETFAQLRLVSARLRQLSVSLGLSSQQAVDALTLQSNQVFQLYLTDYGKVSAELTHLSAKYLVSHPVVITKEEEKNAALTALLQQAKSLLGRSVSLSYLQQLNISGGASGNSSAQRGTLFQELISLQTQQQGLQAQAQEFEEQIKQLESRLTILTQQASKLDNLQRNTKIAEAVFSSTLTRLDVSKSNITASYPQTVVLSKPNLPEDASGPKDKIVLLGTVIGSLFLTTGTISLGLIANKNQRIKPRKL